MENTSIITEKLLALGEPSYRDFSASLMPTVDPATVIGIRMPALRKLASELYGTPEAELFCRTLPHVYFEEYNLHGCLIEKRRSYEAVIEGLEALLPYIDNWATCDMISPPVFKRRPPALIDQICIWLETDRTYTIRFGLRTLMAHYLDDGFAPFVLELAASVRSENYYLRMMVAWFFLRPRWLSSTMRRCSISPKNDLRPGHTTRPYRKHSKAVVCRMHIKPICARCAIEA